MALNYIRSPIEYFKIEFFRILNKLEEFCIQFVLSRIGENKYILSKLVTISFNFQIMLKVSMNLVSF